MLALLSLALLVQPIHAARKPPADAKPATPPSTARWTLYCQAIGGPAHVEQANNAKSELVRTTGLKDWYVIHQEGQSVIYYGFYRAIDDGEDRRDAARAQADRKLVDGLVGADGSKIFTRCFFVEVSAPDPQAPPEWNLLNADGYWSLQIAAYKDSSQRKQAAVEAVRAARAQQVPAYYYHGETTSSVCIGVWPRNAVREQDEAVALANDPTQDLLVLPQPLEENFQIRNREGERVKAVAPRTEVVDPSLLAAIEQYPTHAVNGEVRTHVVEDPATGKQQTMEDPSFLVVVPRPSASLLRAERPRETPLLLDPVESPAKQGSGKLKSIGD
jgi:hypothetical protein